MAIKITENGNVKYENEPNVERDLLPNLREGGVTDVKINGVSIVGQDGSAEIPIGTNTTAGLVKGGSNGVIIRNDGLLAIDPATDEIVKIGTNGRNPIVPGRQDVSTFYGLAKAAGDTTQSASSNAVGAYTDNAKAAIKDMLGITELKFEKINLSTNEQSKTTSITKDSFNLFLFACPNLTQNNGIALYYNYNNNVAGSVLHTSTAFTVTVSGIYITFAKTSAASAYQCFVLKITTP